MTGSRPTARPLLHRLAPALSVVLLVALFAGGVHHHVEGSNHGCAVCIVGHSPAVPADAAAAVAAPDGAEHALHARACDAPRAIRIEAAPTRAPPRA